MRTMIRRSAAAVGAGLLGTVMAVAAATPASAFVTPRYGMTCYTGTSGGFTAYRGFADCYSPNLAKWLVRVNCYLGGTYDSLIYLTDQNDGWVRGTPPQTCYWGINSVTVVELR